MWSRSTRTVSAVNRIPICERSVVRRSQLSSETAIPSAARYVTTTRTAPLRSSSTTPEENSDQTVRTLHLGTVKFHQSFFHPFHYCKEHQNRHISHYYMHKLSKEGFDLPMYFEVPRELMQAGLLTSTDETDENSLSSTAAAAAVGSEQQQQEQQQQQQQPNEDPNAEPPFLQPLYFPPLLDKVLRLPDDEANQLMGMTKDHFLLNIVHHNTSFYTNDPAKVTPEHELKKTKSPPDDPRRLFRSLIPPYYTPREIFIAIVLGVCASFLAKMLQWYDWDKRKEKWAEYYASNEEPEAEIIQKLYESLEEHE